MLIITSFGILVDH